MTNPEPKVQPQPTGAFQDTANKSIVPLNYEEGVAVDEDGLDDDDFRPAVIREEAPEEPQV